MTTAPMARLAPALIVASLLAGCGVSNTTDRDVCMQYRQFQASADELRQLDPRTATADLVRAAVDRARAGLNQVLASADNALDTSISRARTALLDRQEAALTVVSALAGALIGVVLY